MNLLSKEFIRDVRRVIGLDYLTELLGSVFAPVVHDHDDRYFTETESDARFAPIVHTHDDRYYTETEINDNYYDEGETDTLLAGKADLVHTHDDRYFTETESDARFAPIVHTHDDRYYTETEVDTQMSAKLDSSSYTAADVLTKIKTVDGTGSGLDADLLDGYNTSEASSPSTAVVRNSSGDILTRLFRSEYASTTTTANYVMGQHTLGTSVDNYVRPITINQLGSQVALTPSINMAYNFGNVGSKYRLGIYSFDSTVSSGPTKWHFKTNCALSEYRMLMLEIKGYEYSVPKIIDARHACYAYGATSSVTSKCSEGTHTMDSYKSADGYLCFSIDLTSTYYVGGVLNVFEANPLTMGALEITASGFASAATAY